MITIQAKQFLRALKQVAPARSKKQNYIRLDENFLMASDGFRLHLVKLQFSGDLLSEPLNLEPAHVKKIQSAFKKSKELNFSIEPENHFLVWDETGKNLKFYNKIMGFTRWRDGLKLARGNSFKLDKTELYQALKVHRATLDRIKYTNLKLDTRENKLYFHSVAPWSTCESWIDYKHDKPHIDAGLNPFYAVDFLTKILKSDKQNIEFFIDTPKRPIVLKNNDFYCFMSPCSY